MDLPHPIPDKAVGNPVTEQNWDQHIKANMEALAAAMPAGVILDYAGGTAPTGWLMCDGSAISRTTYATLFTALGGVASPYGLGDGSTTFNLPDARGRVVVGKGTHADVDVLGENDGLVVGSRTPRHKHTVAAAIDTVNYDPGGNALNYPTGGAVNTSGGTPVDAPAHIVFNKIIRT